jgi:hypothetical protein
MATKSVRLFKLHLPKDAPLRKPTPVYFGLCRRRESVCGAYVRVGSCCLFAMVD